MIPDEPPALTSRRSRSGSRCRRCPRTPRRRTGIFGSIEFRGMPDVGMRGLEVAFEHDVKVIVSALGPAPTEVVERAHAKGILVGGMVGAGRHAQKHVEAGADFVVAAGNEGAGHNSHITTMVLVPEVVDAVPGHARPGGRRNRERPPDRRRDGARRRGRLDGLALGRLHRERVHARAGRARPRGRLARHDRDDVVERQADAVPPRPVEQRLGGAGRTADAADAAAADPRRQVAPPHAQRADGRHARRPDRPGRRPDRLGQVACRTSSTTSSPSTPTRWSGSARSSA